MEAAEELGLSVRQVRRLLYALKKYGDKAVIHGLDKASLFQTAEKRRRDPKMPWKGRLERNFGTTQDRLVKGMRVAGVTTL